jgi:hypothetical protein
MDKVGIRAVTNGTCMYTRIKLDWAQIVADRKEAGPMGGIPGSVIDSHSAGAPEVSVHTKVTEPVLV